MVGNYIEGERSLSCISHGRWKERHGISMSMTEKGLKRLRLLWKGGGTGSKYINCIFGFISREKFYKMSELVSVSIAGVQ